MTEERKGRQSKTKKEAADEGKTRGLDDEGAALIASSVRDATYATCARKRHLHWWLQQACLDCVLRGTLTVG
jgi:hypothetical protein